MSDMGGPVQYADAARRYRLDSRIATGGMGVVWLATDTRLDREVAVKVLKHEYADDPTFQARFETEARHAASLHHPGIAGVFDYQADPAGLADGGAPYLVMEYVEGAPLSTLLAQAKADQRRLDPDVVRDLMGQAATALGVAHAAGIVHRDVKPANLLVTPDGQVKVTDFGIARAGDAAQITRTGAVMGTPQYLSPEQARGNVATPASDVYALGVVAFECLAGRRPFEADSPVATALAHLQQPVPDLPADVPADLAAVVTRSMAKNPEERYADGAALATALRDPGAAAAVPGTAATAVIPGAGAAAAGAAAAGIPTPPTSPVVRPEPAAPYEGDAGDEEPKRRSPWPVILLVLLLVGVGVLVAVLLFGGDDEEPGADETTSETTKDRKPSRDADTIVLDPDDYEGRDVDEVETELEELGFDVTLDEIENDGSATEGIVAGIDPSGTVEEGALITVAFYGAAPETSEAPPETPEPSDDPEPSNTPEPSETAEPSVTSEPPETTPTTPTEEPSVTAEQESTP